MQLNNKINVITSLDIYLYWTFSFSFFYIFCYKKKKEIILVEVDKFMTIVALSRKEKNNISLLVVNLLLDMKPKNRCLSLLPINMKQSIANKP